MVDRYSFFGRKFEKMEASLKTQALQSVCAAAVVTHACRPRCSSAPRAAQPSPDLQTFRQTFARSPQTFARRPQIFRQTFRQTFAHGPQTFARSPQTFAPSSQTFARSPQTFVRSPQTFACSPQTFAHSLQTFRTLSRPFAPLGVSLSRASLSSRSAFASNKPCH